MAIEPHPLLVPWSRKSRAIRLLPVWAVGPVQHLSTCTRVHFTFTFNFTFTFTVTFTMDIERLLCYSYSAYSDNWYVNQQMRLKERNSGQVPKCYKARALIYLDQCIGPLFRWSRRLPGECSPVEMCEILILVILLSAMFGWYIKWWEYFGFVCRLSSTACIILGGKCKEI